MPVQIKHTFVSEKGDGPDSTRVQPSDWNADHDVTGLGDAAALDVGTTAGTVAAGDDSRITGAAQKASNLSDLADKQAAFDEISIKASDKSAASTLNLDTATGSLVDVTGNTGITAVTLSNGKRRLVRFTGTPLITHGSSLVLPGAANYQVEAGDFGLFVGYASSVVRAYFFRGSGKSVVAPTASEVSAEALGFARGIRTLTDNGDMEAADAGKIVEMNASTSKTYNIKANSDVAIAVNGYINFTNIGTGSFVVDAPSGVTLNGVNGGAFTLTTGKGATIYKRGTDAWYAPNVTVA